MRIGTAEIYNAIEPLLDASPDFSDALVSAQPFVAKDGDTEIDDVRVVLFVQVADAGDADALTAAAAAGDAAALVELCRCDDAFATALKTTIRERGSPRHVPAIVCRVPDVPRTNNGKKVEMACMNLLRGRPVANRGSIANAGVVGVDFSADGAELYACYALPGGAFARHVPDLFSKQCQNSDWRTCERYIDLHLGWRVLCVTPLHCLQHFIALKPLYARAAGEAPGRAPAGM